MNLERGVEGVLWYGRLLIVVASIASLLLAAGIVFVTTIDAAKVVGMFVQYAQPLDTDARAALGISILGYIVGIIDGYLLGGVMILFALGLYELFVSKIDLVESSEFASRLLLVRSFDDLKNRLARVILLILMVKFLQVALKLKIEGPLELLYLALGIALVGVALLLSNLKGEH